VEPVKRNVDVIHAGGGLTIRAAQQAMKSRFQSSGFAEDMVAEGLVNSMARPNGNTTGHQYRRDRVSHAAKSGHCLGQDFRPLVVETLSDSNAKARLR
jgi:hypothetical protein